MQLDYFYLKLNVQVTSRVSERLKDLENKKI